MGFARLTSRWVNPPGILTNTVTGETKPQGANRFGYRDWPGLVEYAALDFTGPPVTAEQAMGLPGVGRGVRLMAGVIASLTPYRVRNAASVSEATLVMDPNSLLENPDPTWHGRSTWTAAVVRDLMLYGNAFADKRYTDRYGFPLSLPLIPPGVVSWEPSRLLPELMVYAVSPPSGGRVELDPGEMFHAVINVESGRRMGVGILAQYQTELRTMIATERAQWVIMSKGRPVGILSVDADMIDDELRAMKQALIAGFQTDGIAALIKSSFAPVSWNATDLGLVDAREFNLRLASDITGISPYLLGVPSENRVYSNQETEWSNFLRTSAKPYVDAIQDPYTACFPRGTSVRYDINELARPEEKTRWEIYAIATGMGAMSLDEVRQAERMGPMIGDAPPPALTTNEGGPL